ncbi:MAG: hypothetical protein WCJ62_03145 [Flavobacterium sp.]
MPKPLSNLSIKLLGEVFSIKKLRLNTLEQEYYHLIAARIKQPLHKALLDPFFYFHLKLNAVDSLEKLPCEEVSGLMDTPKNQIEIWLDGKKILKLKLDELNQDQYLFPLYNIKKSVRNNQNNSGIYIEQKEIGFIGSYEFKIEQFELENLQFRLLLLNEQLLLQSIDYHHAKGLFKKKETLITYQNSYQL